MKKIFFAFLIVFAASATSFAGKAELMRIKDRAEKGFTNRGRVVYKYTGDSDISHTPSQDIGNVTIEPGSPVKEVYTGVEVHKQLRFDKNRNGNTLQIGTVDSNGKTPRKVNIIVDVDKPIDF